MPFPIADNTVGLQSNNTTSLIHRCFDRATYQLHCYELVSATIQNFSSSYRSSCVIIKKFTSRACIFMLFHIDAVTWWLVRITNFKIPDDFRRFFNKDNIVGLTYFFQPSLNKIIPLSASVFSIHSKTASTFIFHPLYTIYAFAEVNVIASPLSPRKIFVHPEINKKNKESLLHISY